MQVAHPDRVLVQVDEELTLPTAAAVVLVPDMLVLAHLSLLRLWG